MDPDLDDRLEQEAATRRMSKSALVRFAVERELAEPFDNGLWRLPTFDAEGVDDIDAELYGPFEADT